jgi:hypothetical protein
MPERMKRNLSVNPGVCYPIIQISALPVFQIFENFFIRFARFTE